MTNNKKNIENFVDTCKSVNHYHKESFKNIPTSWVKFGEVFCNKLAQPIFVCLICLENADSVNTAFTTSDGSVLWCHIQKQHISKEFETIKTISTEIESFQTNTRSVKSEVSCDEININVAESSDFNNDKLKQNKVKLLEDFHDNLVKDSSPKESKEILPNINIENETQEVDERNILADATEVNIKEDDTRSNDVKDTYTDYAEDETFTISDDEKDDDNENCYNQQLIEMSGDRNVIDYLRHNDMIEISDDEVLDEENEISESVVNNRRTKHNDIEESVSSETTSVRDIPIPDILPCQSLTYEQSYTNLNSSQLNNHNVDFEEDSQSNQTPHFARNRVYSFRPFQCKVCGVRALNEENMKIHFGRIHKSLELGTNQYYHNLYHRVHQSDQNKQHEIMRSYVNQNVEKRLFKCKSCKIGTKTMKAMERHHQLYHSPDTHPLIKQCYICHKRILTTKFNLHLQIHFSPGFNCSYCGHVYKQKKSLNNHISKYHGDTHFNCVPVYPR